MASAVAVSNSYRMGLLRGVAFDSMYILGTTSLAIGLGWLVLSTPATFVAVFVLNAWLLGYPHVAATFTRLTFDAASFKRYRTLVTWLPLAVFAGVVFACLTFGSWILTTIYFYWQWWHYTRQSYGISRMYQRRTAQPDDLLHKAVVYALPVWGILFRSWQAPEQFLFTELRVIPVPLAVVACAGSITLVIIGWWLVQTIKRWWAGTLCTAYTLYLFSHLLMFGVGYLAIDNVNHGWLVLTVWHNSQYILTVWMFNNNRFKNEPDPRHRLLSFLSQRNRFFPYLGVCLLLSTLTYAGLQYTISWIVVATATSLPLFAITFQAINFHHYLVDAVIWRRGDVLRQASTG